MKTPHVEGTFGGEDLFRGCFPEVDDVVGLSDLEVPRKSLGESFSSFRLVSQFSAPSVNPECKQTIIISIPEDEFLLPP